MKTGRICSMKHLRKERIYKCIIILKPYYTEEELMQKHPAEIEELTYKLLNKKDKLASKYVRSWYDKAKNKRDDKKVSASKV